VGCEVGLVENLERRQQQHPRRRTRRQRRRKHLVTVFRILPVGHTA
jgi:hypothetical protein